ncbi:venom peptide SjAPI-like isoform X1 [Belonocnema kinseyi]|uniref:venom peptide SjAPI-like isoform X1 n=1 Tax=Belonocnema kinseyi TaxID=2817044 RepID=UPI00143CC58F|nr:venom peptide SjAPI-like isoform X1 [Belonocnema kinseyi]
MSPIFIAFLIVGVASGYIVCCGQYSIPAQCENPCPKTCANRNDPTIRPCPRQICREGCNCMDGYVKDAKQNNECVLPKNCIP